MSAATATAAAMQATLSTVITSLIGRRTPFPTYAPLGPVALFHEGQFWIRLRSVLCVRINVARVGPPARIAPD
jgi:hypothetical protein